MYVQYQKDPYIKEFELRTTGTYLAYYGILLFDIVRYVHTLQYNTVQHLLPVTIFFAVYTLPVR